MKVSEFDYDLPEGRIALRPAAPRDAARLLVVPPVGAFEDRVVRDLPGLLSAGDLLVVNETKVVPARLFAARADTGGRVEILLLREEEGRRWKTLLGPARRLKPGTRLVIAPDAACSVVAEGEGGERTLEFEGSEPVLALAERLGTTPLPPYIRRDADARDRDDYQTVYARVPGAVAAPTAGLHLTTDLLARLAARGVGLARLTLHVGAGTFRPVVAEDVEGHRMEAEAFEVPAAAARAVEEAFAAGRRVVAVGTTTVRALETAATARGRVAASSGWTDRYITPGHEFRAVTGLLTNFHLPRSTLLMLVSAFLGRERVLSAYAHAIRANYRFYSYGDAMYGARAIPDS